MIRLSFLSIAVVLIVGMANSVQASIVELTFSGTYEGDISGPFSYSMTYDTSLDTNTEFFATGADIAGSTATHEMHAHSASGITALDFQFNGLEWPLSNLMGYSFGIWHDALWFDVDLATGATPTRALFDFGPSGPSDGLYLHMGGYVVSPGNFTVTGAEIWDDVDLVSGTDSLTITRSDPDPIPEPASVITWTLLGVVGCIATWWKRRRKTG